jgi:serine/threonine protein kinase
LQNRYRLLSVLGQGGFGRTYLGEDQGRFNERCALKELTPAQGGEYALDKSKELFQREAQILYQIQHPQIPQFRATFEQDQRLFLVQDYVEGQTYRALLEQRKAQGIGFSEAEVVQLMRQLLPVLAHIHSKGIVHRDIAPDNIILRQQDNKPVLIDFGVVKELATRFQTFTAGVAQQPTTVGKPGYAPSEQMQTGKAYPNSDLYSLAVTVVVLLTGREPQELFDDSSMTWYWQRWVTVSPGLTQVLNRMLSYRPGDRYQTVSDVVQALQGTGVGAANPPALVPPAAGMGMPVTPVQPVQTPIQAPVPQPTQFSNPSAANPPSQMQTMAVGRPVEPTAAQRPSMPEEESRSSMWDDPIAIIAAGIGLIVLTGLGVWLAMEALKNRSNVSPLPSPSPTVSVTPSPSPTATPTPTPSPRPPEPTDRTERLDIPLNGSATRRGSLQNNQRITYVVPGDQGEAMEAIVSGEGILMTVRAPDGRIVDNRANRVSYWQGTLPYEGEYSLELSPVQGLDRGRYELNVNMRTSEPSPSPSPQPPEPPRINEIPVSFQAGSGSRSYSDRLRPEVINRYVVSAEQAGQLTAQVSGGARLRVYDPSGQIVSANGANYWQQNISFDGEYRPGTYRIDVLGPNNADYTLDLTLLTATPR